MQINNVKKNIHETTMQTSQLNLKYLAIWLTRTEEAQAKKISPLQLVMSLSVLYYFSLPPDKHGYDYANIDMKIRNLI